MSSDNSKTKPSATVILYPPPPAGFDPLTADHSTLLRHGFPPRPQDPQLLQHWQGLVANAREYLLPSVRVNEDRVHGPPRELQNGQKTSKNWSGGIVNKSGRYPFETVSGQWTVPVVSSNADGQTYYSAFWAGIDGANGSSDVFQAGVECEVVTPVGGVPERTTYAWLEWYPDPETEIHNFPVAVGDIIQCALTVHGDCLPGAPVNQGKWSSIYSGHTLIPMPDGKVLDWVPKDGSWRLWNYNPSNTGDCLPGAPVNQGKWSSIRSGHTLIPMPDGKVLDWVANDGTWRLWNYNPSNTGDCLPGEPVNKGKWNTIRSGHTLIPMQDGHVLDWVPNDGTWRLWSYNPSNTGDCLPGTPVAQDKWATIGAGHTLLRMHDGHVLDWVAHDGTWRLWNYDPNTLSPSSGSLLLINETHQQYTTIMIAPSGTSLVGNCAEWIVERPSIGGTITQLANYVSASFTKAIASTEAQVTVSVKSGDTMKMVDDHGKVISTASIHEDSVTCTYV